MSEYQSVTISDGKIQCSIQHVENESFQEVSLFVTEYKMSVKVESFVVNYSSFYNDLIKLSDDLISEASLIFYEDNELKLSGDGKGNINVFVKICGNGFWKGSLEVNFRVDQSYLTKYIIQLQDNLLPYELT